MRLARCVLEGHARGADSTPVWCWLLNYTGYRKRLINSQTSTKCLTGIGRETGVQRINLVCAARHYILCRLFVVQQGANAPLLLPQVQQLGVWRSTCQPSFNPAAKS